MSSKHEQPFYQRLSAIRQLITLEIANLHAHLQHSGDPELADWIDRLQTCLRVTNLKPGGNGDSLPY